MEIQHFDTSYPFSASVFSSVQFSCSVMSNSLWPREPQHARSPCPSPTPGVYSNPCPSSRWCHPAISSSVVPFSSCLQSLPASGSFPMRQLSPWGGQIIGLSASASVLPMNTQDWSPLGWMVGSPCGPRDSQEFSLTPQFKSINSLALSFLHSPTLTSIHDHCFGRPYFLLSWGCFCKEGGFLSLGIQNHKYSLTKLANGLTLGFLAIINIGLLVLQNPFDWSVWSWTSHSYSFYLKFIKILITILSLLLQIPKNIDICCVIISLHGQHQATWKAPVGLPLYQVLTTGPNNRISSILCLQDHPPGPISPSRTYRQEGPRRKHGRNSEALSVQLRWIKS